MKAEIICDEQPVPLRKQDGNIETEAQLKERNWNFEVPDAKIHEKKRKLSNIPLLDKKSLPISSRKIALVAARPTQGPPQAPP